MSALSFVFEGIVAALMVALIVYCVRLDRRLAALRENDAPIRALIAELRAAAERAEASVGHLKAAGLDAERSLQQAIRTAQAVEDDLVRRSRVPTAAAFARAAAETPAPAAPASPAPVAAAPPPVVAREAARPAAAPAAPASVARPPAVKPPAAPPATRSDAERDLLRAIRFARAEGDA